MSEQTKTWLITGATGNLGAALLELPKQGDRVYLVSRKDSPKDLEQVAQAKGLELHWIEGDLLNENIGTVIKSVVGDTPIDTCLLAGGMAADESSLAKSIKDFRPNEEWYQEQSTLRRANFLANKSIVEALDANLHQPDKRSDLIVVGSALGAHHGPLPESYLNDLLQLRNYHYWAYARSKAELATWAQDNVAPQPGHLRVMVLSPGFFGFRKPNAQMPDGSSLQHLIEAMKDETNYIQIPGGTPLSPTKLAGDIRTHLDNSAAPRFTHLVQPCHSIDIVTADLQRNTIGLSEIGQRQLEDLGTQRKP